MRYNIWTLKDYTLPDFSGYSSSNTYRVEATNLAGAQALAVQLCGWELAVLGSNVILDRYRIRDDTQGIGDGYYSGSFGFGMRSVPSGCLGNVNASVIVNCYAAGRWVGRKWLRLGLCEGDWSGDDLDPALVALVQSSYADPLGAAGVYRTRADVVIDEARADPRLWLYGLRHGTHRRELLVI